MFEYTTLYLDDPPIAGRAVDLWLEPENRQSLAIFFIHGGGWRMGHRDSQHALMSAFYRKGIPCASVSYRLGNVSVADQLGDVRAGLAQFRKRLDQIEPSTQIVLFGTSAGAHLALLAALASPGVCGEKASPTIPLAGAIVSSAPVTFEPWEDILPSIWKSMQTAAGRPYADNPELYRKLSPETYLRAGVPPLRFLLAEREHMFPNELTLDLIDKGQQLGLDMQGRIYANGEHGFFYDIQRPCQKLAFKDSLEFLSSLSRRVQQPTLVH